MFMPKIVERILKTAPPGADTDELEILMPLMTRPTRGGPMRIPLLFVMGCTVSFAACQAPALIVRS